MCARMCTSAQVCECMCVFVCMCAIVCTCVRECVRVHMCERVSACVRVFAPTLFSATAASRIRDTGPWRPLCPPRACASAENSAFDFLSPHCGFLEVHLREVVSASVEF